MQKIASNHLPQFRERTALFFYIKHIKHSGKLIHELKTLKEDMEIYQESHPLLSLSSDDGFWCWSESNMGLH